MRDFLLEAAGIEPTTGAAPAVAPIVSPTSVRHHVSISLPDAASRPCSGSIPEYFFFVVFPCHAFSLPRSNGPRSSPAQPPRCRTCIVYFYHTNNQTILSNLKNLPHITLLGVSGLLRLYSAPGPTGRTPPQVFTLGSLRSFRSPGQPPHSSLLSGFHPIFWMTFPLSRPSGSLPPNPLTYFKYPLHYKLYTLSFILSRYFFIFFQFFFLT